MIIKKKIKKQKKKQPTNFYKYYFLFTIVTFSLLVLVFLNLGIWANYKKAFFYRIYSNGMINYQYLPQIFVYALKKNFYSYKTIYVNINQKNKIILEKNRLDKINFGPEDYGKVAFISANAFITSKNKIIRTNIRLKGDRDIHYKNIKNSSYKFNLKGENTFFGIKKFSIQKPRIRNYLHEWIFHELMSEGDLIKLKYDFIYFNLNGENMGLYVLEEGFGKELLERNKRRNGPIFSLYEGFENLNIYESKFEIYDDKIWLEKENIDVAKKATQNFKNFLNDKIELSELFDIKKWAWYFAVVDLTYTRHGVLPKSVKFYFNPINGKFEPIPYDGHRMHPNYSEFLYDFDHSSTFDTAKLNIEDPDKFLLDIFLNKFFYLNNNNETLNKQFYFEYIKAIKKICSKEFLDNFFKSRKHEIKKITSAIYSDSFIYDYDWRRKSGVGLYYYDKNDIYFRANKLLNLFSPQKISIFVEEDYDNLIIYSKSIHNLNLNLSEIICNIAGGNSLGAKKVPININLKYSKQILNKKKYSIKNSECNFLSFVNNIDNTKFYKKIDKINGNYNLHDLNKENYKKYFIQKGKNLLLKEKITKILENILIPENYNVVIKNGEQIILKNSAFIFSKSSWQIGGEGEKVFIGGEKNNFGGGILIFDAEKVSKIENTKFGYLNGLLKNNISSDYSDNISNNYQSDFIIFGSINFYNSDVELKNVSFEDISSEDAINIIRSNYKIKDVKFNEIASDAIDIDFSNGEIINSTFNSIGNDGIDFSGSKSIVLNGNFSNVGDKIISVGELSEVSISNIKAKDSYIGVASKDSSNAFVKNIQFHNVKIPFSAYQKKSEYSFSKMSLSNVKSDNYLLYSIRDEKSKIFENGHEIGKFTKNILPIIYEKKLKLLE